MSDTTSLPTSTVQRRISTWRETYAQLLRSAGTRASRLRLSLIELLAAAILQGLSLSCLVPIFTDTFDRQRWGSAAWWIGVMAAMMLLSSILRWHAQGFDYAGHMARTTHELRTRLGEQLRRMPLERLQDKRSGEINATLLGNVDENLHYVLTIVNVILMALVAPLVVAFCVSIADWKIGVCLFLIFPTILPLYRWRRPAFAKGMRRLAEAHQRTNADIVEYAQGLTVLRAAGCEGERAERLQASFAHLQTIQTIGQKKGSKPNLVISSVVELGLLLVASVGVTWVVMGRLDLAVLAAVLVIVVRFAEPLATFVLYTAIFEMIEAALERIEALLAVPPLPQFDSETAPKRFDVRFEDVTFQYLQGNRPAVRGLTIEFPERSLTALVGASGSGKTTVTRLLMRHADAQHGRVTIGGVDIRAIPPERLNALISVVFQDVYLFDDTLLGNIRMARPKATDEEVEAAAHAAQCAAFIDRLPAGWQTRLGDLGGRLSGGERQRISIARALLKHAPIVLLDEPTAALDTESEVAVQRAIDTLVRERTVLVIAHRLSTIVGADNILVFDDGQVVEQGTHRELIDRNGRYCQMWEAQRRVKEWHVAGPVSAVLPNP